jgi:glycosyltransferase involved in cell wall biosynthesis
VRVLQVTPYYAPAWAYGGPPRVMTQFASGLAARGHEVTVLTTDVLDEQRRAAPAEETLDGVHVHRYRNLSNGLAWRRKKYLPPGLARAVARELRRHDVVHVTDVRTLLTASAYVGARARRVPFVLSAHGSLPGSPGLRGQVKRVYDRALVRPMLDRAALLLAQTEHEARLYVQEGGRPKAVRLLPLPLDLDAIPAPRGDGFLRERAGLPEGVPLLLFLGRIHHLKGLDVLIEAVEPLLTAREAALVVVGRDDGQWQLIAQRHARLLDDGLLRFIGPLYGEERFQAYADADVFCLTPRHWEETSLAALEAAAVGTPLVVTEQADVPGLAESGGGLVVPLDVPVIREAVRTALARADEMGPKARLLIERQHGAPAVVEQLERYLLESVSLRAEQTASTSSSASSG